MEGLEGVGAEEISSVATTVVDGCNAPIAHKDVVHDGRKVCVAGEGMSMHMAGGTSDRMTKFNVNLQRTVKPLQKQAPGPNPAINRRPTCPYLEPDGDVHHRRSLVKRLSSFLGFHTGPGGIRFIVQ